MRSLDEGTNANLLATPQTDGRGGGGPTVLKYVFISSQTEHFETPTTDCFVAVDGNPLLKISLLRLTCCNLTRISPTISHNLIPTVVDL